MEKIIILLSFVFILILTGVLYGTNQQPDEVETAMTEQFYMAQFPGPVPDFVLY